MVMNLTYERNSYPRDTKHTPEKKADTLRAILPQKCILWEKDLVKLCQP